MKPLVLSILFGILCTPGWAKARLECWNGDKHAVRKSVGSFVIQLNAYLDNEKGWELCRAVIRDANKKTIFSEADLHFSIALADEDATSGSIPLVVLEAYSGGAHCCWTYYVVSLGGTPGLSLQFENDRPASFLHNKTSDSLEISTLDGAFDYFDFLSHGGTPFPSVYLRLQGKTLIDVSTEHVRDYNREIAKARRALDPDKLKAFTSATDRHVMISGTDNPDTAAVVLRIVFALLYSGRAAEAHKTLQGMWPAFDQQRMWALILQTRREGILRYTKPQKPRPPAVPHPSVSQGQSDLHVC